MNSLPVVFEIELLAKRRDPALHQPPLQLDHVWPRYKLRPTYLEYID